MKNRNIETGRVSLGRSDWLNHRRLLEPIGDVPPAEKEEAYYQRITESALAA